MLVKAKAKLSRLSFRRRLMVIASGAAIGYAYSWRRSLNECDETAVAQWKMDNDSSNNTVGPFSSMLPPVARSTKWAALSAVSDEASAPSSSSKSSSAEENKVFDLIVIGAGANGLFVTLEAARRGLSVATFDACDIGGATSSNTPNLLSTFLPHLFRAFKIFSYEELREAWRQLEELKRLGIYSDVQWTASSDCDRHSATSQIITADVGMAIPTATRMESLEMLLTSVAWATAAKLIGSPSPLGNSQNAGPSQDNSLTSASLTWRESISAMLSTQGLVPYRTLPSRLTNLVSDWLGGNDILDGTLGGHVPASVFYFRHSRLDGARMSLALARTAESIQRKPSDDSTKQDLLPDRPIVLNYAPVRSVGVDAATGLFKVEIRNAKPSTSKVPTTITLTARNVVNCTGPWADALRIAEVKGDVGMAEASAPTPEGYTEFENVTSTETISPTVVPSRRLVRETAPEKATGYPVRQNLESKDYVGSNMLFSNSNGHIYFIVPTSTIANGVLKKSAEAHPLASQINSFMTLTSDAARRYITATPFTATHSLVGLSTVALPLLGWRDTPSASGLPYSDPNHFADVYKWLRAVVGDTGVALPPQPLACLLAASGTLAPLSQVAREVHTADVAIEAVRVQGTARTSALYHVIGGNWLTARRAAVDVVKDIQLQRLVARPVGQASKQDKIISELDILESRFAAPLALVSSSCVSYISDSNVAAALTSAMTADPYVTTVVDVIARRTQFAYTHHAQVKRILPALVDAMAGVHGGWSAERKAEELAAAQWFMNGIAPPPPQL